MTRRHRRRATSSASRILPLIAAVLTVAPMAPPAAAQNPDWRTVDNPYQEDIEYAIGTTHEPRVEVGGVRWRSFKIETPDRDPFAAGEPVSTEVTVEFENRSNKSARILVILLLEDEDGSPLDRIEMKPFKLAGGRLKETKTTAELPTAIVESARRVYLFFEIME
jgi:hypothetical protein